MDDIRSGFFDVVAQVRAHLELQRALGRSDIEVLPAVASSFVPNDPHPADPTAAASRLETDGLSQLREEAEQCSQCTLSMSRKKVVFGEGNPEARIVFIGDAPGQEEDEQGRPFVGPAGQLLTDIIVKGMNLGWDDVYLCTLVKCRPRNALHPGQPEVAACERLLARQIKAINPKIIVALGGAVAQLLLKSGDPITALRGKWREYLGIPLMPTFHPAYLLKSPSGKKTVWGDIKKVLAELDRIEKGNR